MTKTSVSTPHSTEEALLDAAERLLVESGYARMTTRRLAQEARVNQGLIHYHFGSMEHLLVRVLERFTGRLIERQRAMYAADAPFLEKWRQAMGFLDDDFGSGYQKVWFELQAVAWNRSELRDQVAAVTDEWRVVLTEALQQARDEHEIDVPLDALVALVATFNQGMILERLCGIATGHRALIDWIDAMLAQSRMVESP
jgi:AcrR family transcriptional regulator